MGKLFTNLKTDGQITGFSPDAAGDFYNIADKERDTNYFLENMVDLVKSLSLTPSMDCQILYGGIVSDGGSGTIDISAGAALGKDASGNVRVIYLPAQSGIAMPSGWNDGRQIWIASQYDYKKEASTRAHAMVPGESYNYILEDAHDGDANAENKATNGYFYDADPGTTDYVIWGSFTMTGTTFADLSSAERGTQFQFNRNFDSFSFVGEIKAFYDFNGAVTFDTDHWAYCNGATVNDPFSPINGETLPDSSNRYLVGFGTEGGEDIGSAAWATAAVGNAGHTVNLEHDHDSHYHYLGHFRTPNSGLNIGFRFYKGTFNGANHVTVLGETQNYYTPESGGQAHKRRTTDEATGGSVSNNDLIISDTASSDAKLSTTQSIQPRSIRVRYIMRYK